VAAFNRNRTTVTGRQRSKVNAQSIFYSRGVHGLAK